MASGRGPEPINRVATRMKDLDALGSPPKWLAADTLARSRAALDNGVARESWKYSSLTKALRMLTGAPTFATAPLSDVPDGVRLARLSALATPPVLALGIERYPLAGITASLAGEGWLIDVRASPGRPLVLTSATGINAPTILRVHRGCRVEIREPVSCGGVQAAVRILEAAADSTVCWAQTELAGDAEQWWLLRARLGNNARLELHQHAAGARFRRLDTHVTLAGAGANCRASGASVVAPGEHLDRQQVIEHVGSDTLSRTRLHNVARGKSRCSFNGRIHIHPGASGADASLSNRNLALDADAEINTKPELEIYTDDVRCAHGATVGQIDRNALFYLQSRGLPEPLARRLLSVGFLSECIGGPLAAEVLAPFLARLDAPAPSAAVAPLRGQAGT